MGKFNWKCCTVLFTLYFLITSVTLEEHNRDELSDADGMSNLRKKPGLWFGPRMGRRKRMMQLTDNYRTPGLEQEQLDALIEAVQEPPVAVVTISDGKRHTVNFTPRLGRESGEEKESNHWLRNPEFSKEFITPRSPPFAPRLGRRINAYYFLPRLMEGNNLAQW